MGMNPDAAFDAYDHLSEESEVEDDYICEEPEVEPYIGSAFRSSSTNEVYFFLQDQYMRLYYTPGQQTQTDDKILRDLDWICYDFPSLEHTSFSAYGIKCSFDTEDYKAYIFSQAYCVYLDYANNTILSFSTIGKTFPVLENTVFEQNIHSAFRSSRGQEVYLFKGNKYCCLDYDSKQLIDPIRNITEGFPVLKGTIFENGIDACFASHKENEAYLFKGENYVLMNFIDDTLVDDVKPIVDGWSSLKGILPLGDPEPDPEPDPEGMGMNPDAAFAYDYLADEPEVSTYIDSAFRSSSTNEVYFFLQDKYMRLYYTPGQSTQTDDKILRDLDWICYDFPSLEHSSFAAYGIECSFDTEGYKAYLFSECYCVYFDYANDKILSFCAIDVMFPVLENTVFENDIDSAFRSSRGKEVYLFKGNKYGCLDYDSKQLIGPIRNITDGFPVLKGTIFEDGIDACFASHKENEAYLFKGENYVLINFIDDTLVDDVKPIVDGWSSLKDILPLGNPVDDGYPHKLGTNRYRYRTIEDSDDEEE